MRSMMMVVIMATRAIKVSNIANSTNGEEGTDILQQK